MELFLSMGKYDDNDDDTETHTGKRKQYTLWILLMQHLSSLRIEGVQGSISLVFDALYPS